jgi:hypothetical protein
MPREKTLSLPITEEEHKQLKTLAASRGVSMKSLLLSAVVANFVSDALENNPKFDPKSGELQIDLGPTIHAVPCEPQNEEWHRMLELVLTKGTPRDVVGIQANLEWAEGKIKRELDEMQPASGRQRAVGE